GEELGSSARTERPRLALSVAGHGHGLSLERNPLGSSGPWADRRGSPTRPRLNPGRKCAAILPFRHREKLLSINCRGSRNSAGALGARSPGHGVEGGSAFALYGYYAS